MRGSSVHFKRISSALHAVSHASREVPPEYLLPADVSMGTHVVIDDRGQVQKMLDHKMHLASRQAKATKDYSPLWEGVINLPEPSPEVTPERQISIVQQWCKEYEAITGHKVLRADVHLDEGYIDTSGKPQFNAHAHVMCDRTDEKGKVKKLRSTVLRELQDMTAKVTTLQRGIDSRKTGRKHIGHQHFRFDAEKNRLDVEKPKADLARLQALSKELSDANLSKIKDLQAKLDGEPARQAAALAAQKLQLDEQYRLDREALKASGEATQRDYQALKKAHEKALADLATAQAEAAKVPGLVAQVGAIEAQATTARQGRDEAMGKVAQQATEIERLKAEYAAERAALKASGEATQRDYQQLKQQHEAALGKLATAQTEAGKVPELVAQVNALKPKADRVPDLERDLATAQTEAGKVPELVAQVNALKPKADRVPDLERDLAKAQQQAEKVPDLVEQVKALKPEADKVPGLLADLATTQQQAQQVPDLVEKLKASQQEADTQRDYQALKKAHEKALDELTASQEQADKVPGLVADLATAQTEAAKVPGLLADLATTQQQAQQVPGLVEQLKASQERYTTLRTKALAIQGQRDELAKKVDTMTQENQRLQTENERLAERREAASRITLQTLKVDFGVDIAPAAKLKGEALEKWREAAEDKVFEQQLAEMKPPAPAKRPVEAQKRPVEAPKLSKAPSPSPIQEKSLVERLAASLAAMLEWIKAGGGKLDPVEPSQRITAHEGPVLHADDLHCVQRTGKQQYTIHRLADLDSLPVLDDPKTSIRYQNGKGHVSGRTVPGLQR